MSYIMYAALGGRGNLVSVSGRQGTEGEDNKSSQRNKLWWYEVLHFDTTISPDGDFSASVVTASTGHLPKLEVKSCGPRLEKTVLVGVPD